MAPSSLHKLEVRGKEWQSRELISLKRRERAKIRGLVKINFDKLSADQITYINVDHHGNCRKVLQNQNFLVTTMGG